jgi:DNA-binding SARP family transcriptional activator
MGAAWPARSAASLAGRLQSADSRGYGRGAVEFRILGPLEVRTEAGAAPLGGPKPRAVLAMLLLHANRPVSGEQLALALWGEEAPAGATKTVQVHVSRLRKALGDTDLLVTTPSGYELRLQPGQLDAERFEQQLAAGRDELAAGRPREAAAILDEALALWRGRPLDDLSYEPFAQREIARLDDLRVAAFEQLVEAKLQLGRHAEVVGELETLIAAYPYRERLRAQLMLALYRSDRQADALQVYQDARRQLVEELGIEPGDRLRELERAILAQDPALAATVAAPPPPPEPEAPAEPARRLVSVVVAGAATLAERLDPESMHGLLDRYADACAAVIERHGGAVEGYAGDAVVGVFGQAQVREDDALRAVRAAVEMRDASAELELAVKVGIEAGEVFVGAGARRSPFAAGSTFAVATRLEAAAPDGEILLGDTVHELVGHAVRAERADGAWRLVELSPDPGRPHATPFVNRRSELDAFRAAFAGVRSEPACRAVTAVGPPGIGKSRLALELTAAIGDEATVLSGACPSYGEGVTYRPLAEIVRQLGGADRVTELVGELAPMVLAAVGLHDGTAQTEETFWAVRRLFERLAADRPLVVVFEDIHWAEPTLLDLLEYLVVFSRGQPILLVCLARPELLELRPTWSQSSLLALGPLPDAEARALVEQAGGGERAARIVETGEGNPLFLEQLVAVDADALPTSIQAVLAARIDRLEPGERAVLAQASVQGRTFYAGAIEEPGTATRLVALVHKQLIRADRSGIPGQDAFSFAHVLIREAAYRSLPKQRRAELHERFARWLEARPGPDAGIVGYHLAEAHDYRSELGEEAQELAWAAAERLTAAADAALVRGDHAGGAQALERVAALLEHDAAARGEVLPALGAALLEAGRMADATRVLDEAVAAAPEPRLLARAQVERELVRLESGVGTAGTPGMVDEALAVLERERDDFGQCRAWMVRGTVAWLAGRAAAADDAWATAADAARRAGSEREQLALLGLRAMAAALGPAPVADAIAACEAFRALAVPSPAATASTLNPLALLHAMAGDFAVAGELLAEAGAILHELGGLIGDVSHLEASVRMLAGQPDLAEAALRTGVETLSAVSGVHATTTAMLAQAVYAQGRVEEAGELCRTIDASAVADDILTRAVWHGTQAKVLAHEGRADEAEALARAAVALVEPTDLLSHRGDAMLDLADVLRTCGRGGDAERASAAALYERKGNVAAAARARERREGS